MSLMVTNSARFSRPNERKSTWRARRYAFVASGKPNGMRLAARMPRMLECIFSGAAGNPRAAIERRRKRARFVSIELGEHPVNAAGASGLEHLHHRSHVPFGAWECLKYIGDIGAQIVRSGLRPKWVAFVVFDRANCRCDGDDVLLKGFAVNEAYIGEWVVAHGAAHG